jgi:hypothetical protein
MLHHPQEWSTDGQVWLLFGVAGDDLVFDLVVGGFGEDAAGEELVFGGVGAAVDDAFGIGIADTGKGLELVGGGGIDVELVGRGGRGGFGCGGGFGLGYGAEGEREKECGGQEFVAEMEHGWVSLNGMGLHAEEYESGRWASINFVLIARSGVDTMKAQTLT